MSDDHYSVGDASTAVMQAFSNGVLGDPRLASQKVHITFTEHGCEPVLTTVHGSHLYGTAHAESDVDFYVVVGRGKNRSKVVGRVDMSVLSLETFLDNVNQGTHQAVEALFSPYSVKSPQYSTLLESIRPNPYLFEFRARRALVGLERDNMDSDKRERHRRRLQWESDQMLATGWFDPSKGSH